MIGLHKQDHSILRSEKSKFEARNRTAYLVVNNLRIEIPSKLREIADVTLILMYYEKMKTKKRKADALYSTWNPNYLS